MILVTGAGGELGRLVTGTATQMGIDFWDGFGRRPSSLTKVIHCAARHPGASADSLIESNINFLKDTIELAKSYNAAFYFISSVSVYSGIGRDLEINESSPLGARDVYSASKIIGEGLVRESGLGGKIIRIPGLLEQYNENSFITRVAKKILKEEKIVFFGNPDSIFNSFASPIELARLILGDSNPSKALGIDTINFAASPDATFRQICDKISAAACMPPAIIHTEISEKISSVISINKLLRYGYNKPSTDRSIIGWVRNLLSELRP